MPHVTYLGFCETLDPTSPVSLGYTNTLGTLDLLDLDLECQTLSPFQEDNDPVELDQEASMDELSQALCYLNPSHCTNAERCQPSDTSRQ